MKLPILSKLIEGQRFDFATLADNIEQTEEFWEWWWANKADANRICRPEIIEDDDAILVPTVGKPTAHFSAYSEFFDRPLNGAIQENWLPARDGWPRDAFRDLLLRRVAIGTALPCDEPQIVFAGGGYGSGKTSILNYLSEHGVVPLKMGHLVGVDIFKPLIPEYNLIKAVGDGRASVTVQKECQNLATELFELLVTARRSFLWDSSMSARDETMTRIQLARDARYTLTMVAVLTPFEVAVRQAMHRAKISRRFPHPDALPLSHRGFRESFNAFHPLFDHVYVFENPGEGLENCSVIAEKHGLTNGLEIYDDALLSSALCLPKGI